MTHTFEIKETAKSNSLIEHLQTLNYVKELEKHEQKILSEMEMRAKVKKAEKSKSIPINEAIKISEQWIKKRKI